MAITSFVYASFPKNQHTGAAVVDWDTDTLKWSAHTSAYSPNQDTHDFFNDVTNELAASGNYPAGGWAVASKTVTQDTATKEIRLDHADVSNASLTLAAHRYLVLRKDTGTAATSPLIVCVNLGADQTLSNQTLTLRLDATGIVRFAYGG